MFITYVNNKTLSLGSCAPVLLETSHSCNHILGYYVMRCRTNNIGKLAVQFFPTAGGRPWKSKPAKEWITTHLPNQLALKMDGA